MLVLRQKKPPQPPRADTLTTPAPVGGLNARDALALMPATDAVTLDNFFPTPTSVDLRNGYTNWSTGYPADIESLMTYGGSTASNAKLFAFSGTAAYDATTQGAVGGAVVSGLSNARWQHINFGTPGGQFLLTVNGANYPLCYTGSEWRIYAAAGAQAISTITRVTTTATLTTAAPHGLATGNSVTIAGATAAAYNGTFLIAVTGASTFTYVMLSDPGGNASVVGTYTVFAITGVDPRLLIHINNYANRVFLIEKDSTRVWYLPLSSISGAASSLDFGPLMSLGGYIMAMCTWTIDNAAGVNEYACFITSEGEVIMYSGSDPSVAANWVKNGRYRIGRPVGRRCFVRVSSDVILICGDGFMPMSKAILTDRNQEDAISDKIINLVNSAIDNYGSNFGWQGVYSPLRNKLIFNVPQVEGSLQYQFVMNTLTGAWCRFTNWNAGCFEVMGDDSYWGGNLGSTANSALVAKCDVGYSDQGAYVPGEAKTAFSYLNNPGRQKQVTMVRPLFRTSGNIQAAIGIDVDFSDNYPLGTPLFTGTAGTPWSTALWNTFPWATNPSTKGAWQGVTAVGDAISMHIRVVNNKTSLSWQAYQYLYKLGSYL